MSTPDDSQNPGPAGINARGALATAVLVSLAAAAVAAFAAVALYTLATGKAPLADYVDAPHLHRQETP